MTALLRSQAEAAQAVRVDLTAKFLVKAIPPVSALAKRGVNIVDKAQMANGELAYGQVDVLVSNAAVDRYGDSITMEGIDLSAFRTNPVVLWAHDYKSVPIGQVVKDWNDGTSLYCRIQFDVDNDTFANLIYLKIIYGYIRAVSIGGLVTKYGTIEEDGMTWTDWSTIEQLEMIELSVVPVGAHPEALVTAKRFGFEGDAEMATFKEFNERATIQSSEARRISQIEKSSEAVDANHSALRSAVDAITAPIQTKDKAKRKQIIRRRVIIAKRAGVNLDKSGEQLLAVIKDGLEEEFQYE